MKGFWTGSIQNFELGHLGILEGLYNLTEL
jgi:hypothetical protein